MEAFKILAVLVLAAVALTVDARPKGGRRCDKKDVAERFNRTLDELADSINATCTEESLRDESLMALEEVRENMTEVFAGLAECAPLSAPTELNLKPIFSDRRRLPRRAMKGPRGHPRGGKNDRGSDSDDSSSSDSSSMEGNRDGSEESEEMLEVLEMLHKTLGGLQDAINSTCSEQTPRAALLERVEQALETLTGITDVVSECMPAGTTAPASEENPDDLEGEEITSEGGVTTTATIL